MNRLLIFFVFCSYACLIFGMETSSEELEILEYEPMRVHKKYQRDRYLPLYAEKVREKLAQLNLRTTNPREMTAFFNVIIAFIESVDKLSFGATEEAGNDLLFMRATVNNSLYSKRALENIEKAFKHGFDSENLEISIQVASIVFDAIVKNEQINDQIQLRIERDRDPHALRREQAAEGCSWNDAFSIAEYEALSWTIFHLTKLLPVANEHALKKLPENLGNNIFNKPNKAFHFLNKINNLDFLPKPFVAESRYFALPWIEKLQSDINDCCYPFLAKKDAKSSICMPKDIDAIIGGFIAKLYLHSIEGKKYVHSAAIPSFPHVDGQSSQEAIKVKKKKSKKNCTIQ